MLRTSCSLTVLLLVSCGGGGGGSPARVVPRFAAEDVTVPAGQTGGSLELALLGDAPHPVLAQLDLLFDPTMLEFLDPEPLANLPTLDGNLVAPGRYRLVFGDAANPSGTATLATGLVLRLPFRAGAAAGSGVETSITFDASLGADEDGALSETESAPGSARVSFR